MKMTARFLLCGVTTLVLMISACTTTKTGTIVARTYSESARQNYENGEKAFDEKRYDHAIAYYEYVRNKYPYSSYAADSDLRIADSYFMQHKWLEAADAYDFFVRFHPVHDKVAYGYFMQAKSNFNAMPTDFFLFPAAYTKDQSATKEALASIKKFINQYPKDENIEEAKEIRTKLHNQIALQNKYIADFYSARKRYKGAARRYGEIVREYPETETARMALLQLATLERDYLEKGDDAKKHFEQLVRDYPGTSEAEKAQASLQ